MWIGGQIFMTVAKILVVEDEGLRVMELQRKLKF